MVMRSGVTLIEKCETSLFLMNAAMQVTDDVDDDDSQRRKRARVEDSPDKRKKPNRKIYKSRKAIADAPYYFEKKSEN